jgi:glycosyltransferase involved in cell wall biosynthesis
MIVHKEYVHDTRVRRYAEALVSRGAHVDVLCTRDPRPGAPRVRQGVTVYEIPCAHRHGGRCRQLLEYGVGFVMYAARLLVLHLRHRYDVVHVHNMPDFLVFAALPARLLGARLILDVHDPMPEFYLSKFGLRGESWLVKMLRLQERLSAALAHRVITASPHFRANLIRRGIPAGRVEVILNYPDPAIFRRSSEAARARPQAGFTLIYPGTLAPRYGLDVAIRALPALRRTIPDVRLLLIGPDNAYAGALRSLADQLGVAAAVQLVPSVAPAAVARHLAAADVGIYPALPDPHMSIAVPTKVLEYAVMGLPIVTSRVQIVEELFGEQAVSFFRPGSVDEFTARVLELHASPRLARERVRQADLALARLRSWAQERTQYFTVIDRLVMPVERGTAA